VEADLVVVPDAGALDVEMAAALVEACPDGTRLLLAGDPAELPSSGPGRVFGDVVAAGVLPVARTQTAGPEHETPIEQLLGAVREGELVPVEAPGKEVVIVPAAGAAEAVHRAVQLVTDSIPRALGIPAEDVQAVAPAAGGEAGTAALNSALKERLNPGPGKYRGFDPGDRVVVAAPLAGVQVGETGTVRGVAGAELQVEFPQGVVGVAAELVPRLRPGWAITVPQALGTRWRAVVAIFTAETPLTRPLVASAIARAAEHLSIVHAAGPELARAVQEEPGTARQTRLTGLLRAM
jgi:ATP-dependent exoDNAse (exonuclease V) alpha subunit